MRIDLTRTVFTPRETDFIIGKLKQASERGLIASRSENNPYLVASFMGVEERGITPKWNVKIYTYNKKKRGHSLVCVDKHVLGRLGMASLIVIYVWELFERQRYLQPIFVF